MLPHVERPTLPNLGRDNCVVASQQIDRHNGGWVKLCLPPLGPHVRFRRVQTLVREGSPLVAQFCLGGRESGCDPADEFQRRRLLVQELG
jgi:hypothetical protein